MPMPRHSALSDQPLSANCVVCGRRFSRSLKWFKRNKFKCPFCGGQIDWEPLFELIMNSLKLLRNLLKPPDK
jgi:hypothetical protein